MLTVGTSNIPVRSSVKPTQTKTTVEVKMDSKEGIEQVAPVDARAAGLLDPSLLRSGKDDAATADPPRGRAGGPVGSPTSPGENPRWESCCLDI